jgi:hypothetical protein
MIVKLSSLIPWVKVTSRGIITPPSPLILSGVQWAGSYREGAPAVRLSTSPRDELPRSKLTGYLEFRIQNPVARRTAKSRNSPEF